MRASQAAFGNRSCCTSNEKLMDSGESTNNVQLLSLSANRLLSVTHFALVLCPLLYTLTISDSPCPKQLLSIVSGGIGFQKVWSAIAWLSVKTCLQRYRGFESSLTCFIV